MEDSEEHLRNDPALQLADDFGMSFRAGLLVKNYLLAHTLPPFLDT